ncbi:MAG: hypothetical protein IOC82_07435 [Aestuariivirga sp.]|nr:hypothetical protein [Aestuariivirga sp.]
MTLHALMSGLLARCETAVERAFRSDASGPERRGAARCEFIDVNIIERPLTRDPDGGIDRRSPRD